MIVQQIARLSSNLHFGRSGDSIYYFLPTCSFVSKYNHHDFTGRNKRSTNQKGSSPSYFGYHETIASQSTIGINKMRLRKSCTF